ncbi:MAG: hypothetical protein HS111_06800 [Kofleriaceae bacterium]|nr:hypothetical protein [Kofleriaceae bacterium]MCL4225572.1 hypothetical protein [Myxococcales bacterium]
MSQIAPGIDAVHIVASQHPAVRAGRFPSIAEADAMLAHAFTQHPPVTGPTGALLAFSIRWSDGHQIDGRTYVDAHVLRGALADGGILRHLFLRSARAQASDSRSFDWAVGDVRWTNASRADLVSRLGLEAAIAEPRNAAGPPRVERVTVTVVKDGAHDRYLFDNLADADAKLAAIFTTLPDPGVWTDWIGAVIDWSDGEDTQLRFFVTRERLVGAAADGGILRHALLVDARLEAAPTSYRGYSRSKVAKLTAAGRAMLARIEAEPYHDEPQRNARLSTWRAPSLLPDPTAAIARLRDRFADRRRIVASVGDRDDASGDGTGHPATNHADVRYASNHITLALRNDLRSLEPTAAAIVWNHWRSVRDTIETLLRKGDDTDEYGDNEGFWTRQLPALVRLLDDARGRRNGALHFRPVGARGEAYPAWVTALRGLSGAYVIRAPDASGERVIVYVGSSSADRLYETLTRHLQIWRRWQGHGRDYGEGHDPGLTYNRDTAEAAVIVTPRAQALDMETHLIETLRPRDNILGKPNTEDWDWYFDASSGSANGVAADAPF